MRLARADLNKAHDRAKTVSVGYVKLCQLLGTKAPWTDQKKLFRQGRSRLQFLRGSLEGTGRTWKTRNKKPARRCGSFERRLDSTPKNGGPPLSVGRVKCMPKTTSRKAERREHSMERPVELTERRRCTVLLRKI